MNKVKKIIVCMLSALMMLSAYACDRNSKVDTGFAGKLQYADSAAMLDGTTPTNGAISFVSRVAAYDLAAPAHVVVRVKITGSFGSIEIGGKKVSADLVSYNNEKLVIHVDAFKIYTTKNERTLTVFNTDGDKGEIPLIIANKIIYSEEEFQLINYNAEALAGNYVLANDLDFTGIKYTMLGCKTNDGADEKDNPFNGLFEGAGYSIANVIVNQKGDVDADGTPAASGFIAGLFKVIGSRGTVRNLAVKNIKVSVNGGIGGGLVGMNKGRVANCFVESNVTPTGTNPDLAYNEPCGGLVGFNAKDISNCIAYTRVDGMGFCGGNFGNITNSYAVAKEGSGLSSIGGFLHVGSEKEEQYKDGFEVKNQFACDMFEGFTKKCAVSTSADDLKKPANFDTFSSAYWNISADGIKLHKMFLAN